LALMIAWGWERRKKWGPGWRSRDTKTKRKTNIETNKTNRRNNWGVDIGLSFGEKGELDEGWPGVRGKLKVERKTSEHNPAFMVGGGILREGSETIRW